jgi:hypothetical protein
MMWYAGGRLTVREGSFASVSENEIDATAFPGRFDDLDQLRPRPAAFRNNEGAKLFQPVSL